MGRKKNRKETETERQRKQQIKYSKVLIVVKLR